MPARARLVPLGVALLACVFGARLAPADEDQPTPGAAFDRVVAAFPAPSAAGGFEFRGVLRLGGRSLGHARLAVSPGPDGTWEAQDRFVLKGHAVPVVETSTARLSPQLKLAQGDARTTAAGRPGLAWVRAADALAVSRTGVEQPVQVPLAGSALNTL
ncbi:MAG: hypothetical protein O2894_12325, partial [Planctomycetota bacterium]|nr:hypothetical protein [Planctomycetota bacterium]